MPTPPQDLPTQAVITVLRTSPQGATIEEIEHALPTPPKRGALQFWLTALVKKKQIYFDGTRYHLVPAAAQVADAGVSPNAVAPDTTSIPPTTPSVSPAAPVPASEPTLPVPRNDAPTAPVLPAPVPPTPSSPAPAPVAQAPVPLPPVSPITAPPAYTGPASGPVTSASADPHRFADLFEDCVNEIIPKQLSRVPAVMCLREAAREELTARAERRAFVTYAKERLDKLTLKEAVAYDLEPEQYNAWRAVYVQETATPANTAAEPELPEDEPEEPAAPKPAAAARKAASRASVSSSGSPRTMAKMLADQVARLTGSNSALLKAVLTTLAFGLITPLIQHVTSSAWVTLGVVAAVAAVVFLIMWARGGQTAEDPKAGTTEDGASDDRASDGRTVRRPSLIMRRAVAALGIVLVLGVAGVFVWYRTAGQRPSADTVREFLGSSLAPLPVRVVTVNLTYGATGSAGCAVTYQCVLATTEPLYRQIDASDYLRSHAAAELTTIDAAEQLLKGPDGARLRTLAGVGPDLELLASNGTSSSSLTAGAPASRLTLLTVQTPPGYSTMINGTLFGYRQNGTWSFTNQSLALDRSRFPGEPKPAGAAVFAVDAPADAAQLQSIVAEHVAYAAKIQAAAKTLAVQLEQDRKQKADAFAQRLRVGTLLLGTTRTIRGDTYSVALVITETLATTHGLTVLLHNDGGWADARPFQGEWALDPDGEDCTITLRTRNDERVADAGPLIQDPGDASITLQLRADGTVSGTPGQWQLHRIEAADAAAVKADFSHGIATALAATKAGSIYRGTAVAQSGTAAVFPLGLRFTKQDAAGALLATLETPGAAGTTRLFHGTIVDDTYRAGMTPIRLQSMDSERVSRADAKSPLGLNTGNNSFTLALRVDNGRLVGQDAKFAYDFALAESGDLVAQDVSASSGAEAVAVAAVTSDSPATPTGYRVAAGPASTVVAYPEAAGGYALIDGQWHPLTANNARIIQSTPQSLTQKLIELTFVENRLAGMKPEPQKDSIADLTFDGRDAVPTVASDDVVLVYVGRITPPSQKQLEQYPFLKDEPAIELAPTKVQKNNARLAPLYVVAPGFIGFAANRVTTIVEQPAKDITVLRRPAPVPAGRYALFCGARSYEVVVQ